MKIDIQELKAVRNLVGYEISIDQDKCNDAEIDKYWAALGKTLLVMGVVMTNLCTEPYYLHTEDKDGNEYQFSPRLIK